MFWLFIYISYSLHVLIDYQQEIQGVSNIMKCLTISWTSMACNVVCYIIYTDKAVYSSITSQGSFLLGWLFCKKSVHTRFAMTWLIFSNIDFS